ncbi:hypothetical protein R83H12_01869 [Fibrobacteria bacterium R8-3-H12]
MNIPKKSAITATDKNNGIIRANYTFLTDEAEAYGIYQIWLIYSDVELQVSDGQYRLTFSNPQNGAASYNKGQGQWIYSSTAPLFSKYVLATKNVWKDLASSLRETVGGTQSNSAAFAPSNSVAAAPSKPAFTAPPGSAAAKWEYLANSNNCRSGGENANCATILQQWGQELYKLEEQNNAGHDGSLPIFLDYVKYFPDAPAAPNMLFQSAFILESKGELNQAFELRQTFVKKYPNHALAPAAWLRIGEYYYNNSKWADAINAYEKIANAPANTPREKKEASYAIYHLAESHYNLGDYKTAAQKFSEYIDGANMGKYIEDLRNEAKDYLSRISK